MTGLVLEGGGMRGAFTAGVLDAFLNSNIHFDSVYGVSAGASNGASYVARQFQRNKKVFVDYVEKYSYFSPANIFKQRNLLDVELLFNTYPNDLIPFDYETFESSPSKFYSVLTDCVTGKPVYLERGGFSRKDFMMKVLAGSNSLPLLSPAVSLNGRFYLDGGISDSIPLRKAERDGCEKNIIILTREAGYRKEASSLNRLVKMLYLKWPEMTSRFENRHNDYNNAVDYCEQAEKEGRALIIRPETTMEVGRTEKDVEKLRKLYNHGFETAETLDTEINAFLRRNEP